MQDTRVHAHDRLLALLARVAKAGETQYVPAAEWARGVVAAQSTGESPLIMAISRAAGAPGATERMQAACVADEQQGARARLPHPLRGDPVLASCALRVRA